MNNIYNDLSLYIKYLESKGLLMLFKSREELQFLNEWLLPNQDTNSADELPAKDESIGGIINACIKCKNAVNRRPGTGSGRNRIMIILNTPSDISRHEREKLKNESRELLNKMMAAIKVNLMECYITNLIKCETDSSALRPGEMLKNCEPILIKEIDEFKPGIIIIMGDDIPIKKAINERKNISWYTINHPLTLIKKTSLKKPAWEILQSVMVKLNEKAHA